MFLSLRLRETFKCDQGRGSRWRVTGRWTAASAWPPCARSRGEGTSSPLQQASPWLGRSSSASAPAAAQPQHRLACSVFAPPSISTVIERIIILSVIMLIYLHLKTRTCITMKTPNVDKIKCGERIKVKKDSEHKIQTIHILFYWKIRLATTHRAERTGQSLICHRCLGTWHWNIQPFHPFPSYRGAAERFNMTHDTQTSITVKIYLDVILQKVHQIDEGRSRDPVVGHRDEGISARLSWNEQPVLSARGWNLQQREVKQHLMNISDIPWGQKVPLGSGCCSYWISCWRLPTTQACLFCPVSI